MTTFGVLHVPDSNTLNAACCSLTEKLSLEYKGSFRVIPLKAPNLKDAKFANMIGVMSRDAVFGGSLPGTWHGFYVGRVDIDPKEADKIQRLFKDKL
jgi:hypothetical protein